MLSKLRLYDSDNPAASLVQQKRISLILDVAEKYFVEQGLAESKMEDIADRAGVSRQTLYRYYRSKEHLALNVEVRVLKKILGRFVELFSSASLLGLKQLEHVIDEVCIDFLKEYEQQILFTALFDAFFVKYHTPEYIHVMKKTVSSFPNPFTDLISREQKRRNASETLNPLITGEMLNHSLLSLSQRVLLRREALREEYGFDPIELVPLQMKIFIRGILCREDLD